MAVTEAPFDATPFHSPRPGRTGGYGKRDRLLTIGDYRRVYNRGFHASSKGFGCYVFPNRLGRSQLGLSVSRKYARSHLRNRMKRQLREAFRRLRDELPAGMDIILVPRRAAKGLPLGLIASEMDSLVRRALAERRRRR